MPTQPVLDSERGQTRSTTKIVPFAFTKEGIFYFSRRIPSDLRSHYATDRISFSLQTRSARQAMVRSSAMAAKRTHGRSTTALHWHAGQSMPRVHLRELPGRRHAKWHCPRRKDGAFQALLCRTLKMQISNMMRLTSHNWCAELFVPGGERWHTLRRQHQVPDRREFHPPGQSSIPSIPSARCLR